MANAASLILGSRIDTGIVITKYDHSKGPIANFIIREAGHPIPDENSFTATQQALDLVSGLTAQDTVLFLLSGGGSALFEQPRVPGAELQDITSQLLASGADIVEMNTIRKRLSAVKGGRFAQHCAPARVFSIVLSDILGDPLDMIASGPAVPDTSTCAQALAVAKKYHLALSAQARALLAQETPKTLPNVTTKITGSVRELCRAAASACRNLGYEPVLLTDQLCCEAREAGSFLGSIVRTQAGQGKKLAYIAGGETIVHLTGKGLGGRNQELALAAAVGIQGLSNVCVISVGSDGTDGPTDAAGGYVDGDTVRALTEQGLRVADVLAQNDAYHALKAVNGLILTGPTGTNVNDVAVARISLYERHRQLIAVLYKHQNDTVGNLAFEFNVSSHTISNDIRVLELEYPIYTKVGAGGGVFILDSSRLQQRWLTVRQRELLMSVCDMLNDKKALLMKSIIGRLSP